MTFYHILYYPKVLADWSAVNWSDSNIAGLSEECDNSFGKIPELNGILSSLVLCKVLADWSAVDWRDSNIAGFREECGKSVRTALGLLAFYHMPHYPINDILSYLVLPRFLRIGAPWIGATATSPGYAKEVR
jgi:hypothetical protein